MLDQKTRNEIDTLFKIVKELAERIEKLEEKKNVKRRPSKE